MHILHLYPTLLTSSAPKASQSLKEAIALYNSNIDFADAITFESVNISPQQHNLSGKIFFLSHAPNVSTTSGTHFQPSLEHMGSWHVCFLSSVCLAAAPITTPASDKTLDLSSEVIKTSMESCRLITSGPTWN